MPRDTRNLYAALTSVDRLEANLGYLRAECKTKETCATAHDVKTAVLGAKYLLLCEWLDMTPISTAGTDVDEVLIRRKAKGSDRRFHPFVPDVFDRLLLHV